MSAPDQRNACQQEAFNLLQLADQHHEEARATVAAGPRVDKYHDASRHYEMAAQRFGKCLADVATDMERRRLLGWHEFSIAMQYANIADEEYLMPDPDKRAVVNATRTALGHLTEAQNVKLWGLLEQLTVRTKWRELENSIKLLAVSRDHSEGASLVQSIGDQVGLLRITSRSWWGKFDALRCEALATSDRAGKARLLREAEEAARWAVTLRLGWVPFQYVLEKVVAQRHEHEDIAGIRLA